jgi:hypothetical protein
LEKTMYRCQQSSAMAASAASTAVECMLAQAPKLAANL